MRVIRTTWRGSQEMPLHAALAPEAETIAGLSDFFGRLLAALVMSGALTLKDAGELVEEYDLEEVK